MKSKEDLNTLKKEDESVNKKLTELSEEELKQVSGGDWSGFTGKQNIIPPSAESLIAPTPCNAGGQGLKPSTAQPAFGGRGPDFNIRPTAPQTMEPQVAPLPYVELSSDWEPK